MNFEQPFPKEEKIVDSIDQSLVNSANEFLGEAIDYIDSKELDKILANTQKRLEEISVEDIPNKNNEVSYNKHNKTFIFKGKPVSAGQIISSRHLGQTFSLPKTLDASLEGRKLQNLHQKAHLEDYMFDEINKSLATNLSNLTQNRDLLLSKAYEAIARRTGESKENNEQLGVIAEKIIFSVAEMIAIDRPDLGVTVHQSNAYQDVEEKIDFIIATRNKKRGAQIGIEDQDNKDRHIGIQFTINTTKEVHKKDQIAKAKARGIDVDDIVYVAVEGSILRKAIEFWNKDDRPISGPWDYLPAEAKKNTIKALFTNIISEAEELSLLKNIK